MDIRLTHLDGKLPNLALMKLAHWHKAKGDAVYLARTTSPDFFEPQYDIIYGSAIFDWSRPKLKHLLQAFPDLIYGGTGTDNWTTVEHFLGESKYEHYDYSIYPDYRFSLGFTQRGCRLNCGFCVVPKKEGKPESVNTIWDIWRPGTPRCLVLMDNDFFGQPEQQWRDRLAEILDGNFKVSFSQGINIRMITEESASAIASIRYYDSDFVRRRLYTAWDNLGQEGVFFRGLDLLKAAGIKPDHIMVYMLIGYKPGETFDEILYRYGRLVDSGVKPYPMVFQNDDRRLKLFQKWVVGRYAQWIPWADFSHQYRRKGLQNASEGWLND